MISIIITAIVVFIATNIDDILVLMLLFSNKNNNSNPLLIIIGQYIGFIVLVVVSFIGYFGGLLIPDPIIGLLGIVPIIIGIIKVMKGRMKKFNIIINDDTDYMKLKSNHIKNIIVSTMLITIANGGDNIGIYITLFARLNAYQLAVTLLIFLILIGVWCIIGYKLIKQKQIAIVLTRYGDSIVPFVLIGLGILIIIQSEAYKVVEYIL